MADLRGKLNAAEKLAGRFEETCNSYSDLKRKINEIKVQESSTSRELSELLAELREKNKEYGFQSIQCKKGRNFVIENICEHANALKLEIEALGKAISEKSDYLDNLSNQFVALNNLVSNKEK